MNKLKLLCAVAVFILVTAIFTATSHATEMIRVGLLRSFYNATSANIATTNIDIGRSNPDGSFNFNRTLTSPNGFNIRAEGGQIVVRAGGSVVFTFVTGVDGAPQIRATDGGTVRLGNYSYRGVIEFRARGNTFTPINVLPLEWYLYGVVPMEMGPAFHTEALRAQAVAARTFAVYNRDFGTQHQAWLDVCDSTCCQVYHGAGRENDIITQAVRDTYGIMVRVDGRAVFTPFFSSSGGATDNSENVWFAALPHLRGVPDSYETNPRVWTRDFTWAQLTTAVAAQAPNANIGTVTGVSITETNLGRVQELTFIGTNGQWSARREATRTMFRHVGGALLNRNFYIVGAGAGTSEIVAVTSGLVTSQSPLSALRAVNQAGQVAPLGNVYIFDGVTTRRVQQQTVTVTGGTGITINGRGWGHGVGMSQNGANGMAHAGYTFREILKHFYTGVDVY